MLYGRHLGYKGRFEQDLASRDPKALELYNMVEELKDFAKDFMQAKVVWQFFETERDGNSIHLFQPKAAEPLHTFHFGRQPRENGLCLSDYILPAANGERDVSAVRRPARIGAAQRARQRTRCGRIQRPQPELVTATRVGAGKHDEPAIR